MCLVAWAIAAWVIALVLCTLGIMYPAFGCAAMAGVAAGVLWCRWK